MGNLPKPRITPSRPFQHTGVDYAGPIQLRTTKGRGHKAYKAFIAVFVCFSTRAVHLEAVSDYTAAAFLAAFRRFVSRRGLCQDLYSDCGTNFVGADKQLRAMFQASSAEGRTIASHLAEDRVHWHFNPPAAPHFGGLWEAAVKSLKHHLRRVIGETTLTFEEMATLLAQVEACLNFRPLQPLSDDPDDLAALTPGHFLIGSAIAAVPQPINDDPGSSTAGSICSACGTTSGSGGRTSTCRHSPRGASGGRTAAHHPWAIYALFAVKSLHQRGGLPESQGCIPEMTDTYAW